MDMFLVSEGLTSEAYKASKAILISKSADNLNYRYFHFSFFKTLKGCRKIRGVWLNKIMRPNNACQAHSHTHFATTLPGYGCSCGRKVFCVAN